MQRVILHQRIGLKPDDEPSNEGKERESGEDRWVVKLLGYAQYRSCCRVPVMAYGPVNPFLLGHRLKLMWRKAVRVRA